MQLITNSNNSEKYYKINYENDDLLNNTIIISDINL